MSLREVIALQESYRKRKLTQIARWKKKNQQDTTGLKLWCAYVCLLTCPSSLVPGLVDEVLFLKGIPTFHPFVCGWTDKRRKCRWKMLKTVRGELKEMPSRAQDARLTMAYLVFGCHLLSQSLQAVSHLCDTNTKKRYCYKLRYYLNMYVFYLSK